MADGPARQERVLAWSPGVPRLRPLRLAVAWLVSALAFLFAAWVIPGAEINGFWGAIVVAAIVAALNAVLPPVVAALRLPFTVAAGFLLVLAVDAAILLLAADIAPDQLDVSGFGAALLGSLIATAGGGPLGGVGGGGAGPRGTPPGGPPRGP